MIALDDVMWLRCATDFSSHVVSSQWQLTFVLDASTSYSLTTFSCFTIFMMEICSCVGVGMGHGGAGEKHFNE